VILHYHATQRDDTPFWRHAASMPIPDSLAERVEMFRDRGLLFQVGADEYFSQGSWMAVMMGQGITPRAYNPLYDYQNLDQVAAGFEQTQRAWAATANALPAHEDYLKAKGMWAEETAAAA
jgi:tryptophan halogenase